MKPWLLLPASVAYHIAPIALRAHQLLSKEKSYEWSSFRWKNLEFSNPLGTSGGLDKNAEHIHDWWSFGPGFLELGTVTPEPQTPNPGKIMDRDNGTQAVWNKMGFPNVGLKTFRSRIEKIERPYVTPLFINVGKNRGTPNTEAHKDYIKGIETLHPFADAFVINISSPNTKGLRDLLKEENLKSFLQPIINANQKLDGPKPLLLKLSPDQTREDLKTTLNVSFELGMDGWILTNTTNQLGPKFGFSSEGGTSGAPLAELSTQLLQQALEILGDRKKEKLVISSGGVMSPDDVFHRLKMGADLVQVYSALIFSGPGFFRQVAYTSSKGYS